MNWSLSINVFYIHVRLAILNECLNNEWIASEDSLVERESNTTVDLGLPSFHEIVQYIEVKVC
jgi:hypothetical protein